MGGPATVATSATVHSANDAKEPTIHSMRGLVAALAVILPSSVSVGFYAVATTSVGIAVSIARLARTACLHSGESLFQLNYRLCSFFWIFWCETNDGY